MLNTGSVYYMDDKGRCTQCFTAEGPVKFLLYSEGRDMIVVVTEGLILSQHRVAHDGTTSEVAKVRTYEKFVTSMFYTQKREWIHSLSLPCKMLITFAHLVSLKERSLPERCKSCLGEHYSHPQRIAEAAICVASYLARNSVIS